MLVCYSDGGCNNKTRSDAYGSFAIYKNGKQEKLETYDFEGCQTSNEAEYETLITLLEYLNSIYFKDGRGEEPVQIYADSKLVVNQVNGGWACEASNLIERRHRAVKLLNAVSNVKLTWVPRAKIVAILGH
jgi:ribonuclease HI